MELDEGLVERMSFNRASLLAALSVEESVAGNKIGLLADAQNPALPKLVKLLANTAGDVLPLGSIPASPAEPFRRQISLKSDGRSPRAHSGALRFDVCWRTVGGKFLIGTHSVGLTFNVPDMESDLRRYGRYSDRLRLRRARLRWPTLSRPVLLVHYWPADEVASTAAVEESGGSDREVVEAGERSVRLVVKLNPLISDGAYIVSPRG